MNYYTRQIAALLNIDLETARRVQDEMECNDFDFSEATDQQFKREAKLCYFLTRLMYLDSEVLSLDEQTA